MKFKKFHLLIFCLIFFGFLFQFRYSFAEVIFQISPLDYSSFVGQEAIASNYYRGFYSWICTATNGCPIGSTIYNVGVWLTKVGNPDGLAMQENQNFMSTNFNSVSNIVDASDIPSDNSKLIYFYFPQGVTLTETTAFNLFISTNSNIIYPNDFYYIKVWNGLYGEDDYTYPQSWCFSNWGCASSRPFISLESTSTDLFAKPKITLLGDNPLKISASTAMAYTDPGATALDNLGNDITANISVSNNVDITATGTYTVVYTVSDKTGNIASSTRVVDVVAPDAPEAKPTCCSNVLFIPGLEASRLYDEDGNQIWEPGILEDNSQLDLDESGTPIRDDIYTKDVIDNAYVPVLGNIYKSFIAKMNEMKSAGTINDWSAAPYDWRLSLDEILNNGNEDSAGDIYYSGDNGSTSSPYIITELRRLAESSQTGKVAIIAHSNGGLVAKALTDALGSDASKLIDKIIFVAVPQVGTPKAIGAILHGFDSGLPISWFGFYFSPEDARNLGENMPSVYNLLPSADYFSNVSDPAVTFDNSDFLAPWRKKYGNKISSENKLENFLDDQSRPALLALDSLAFPISANKNLLNDAQNLHDSELDDWTLPSGVALTEIAGWGEDTVKSINYYEGYELDCPILSIFSLFCATIKPTLEYDPIMTSDGDGTVVTPSALWMATSTEVGRYWVNLNQYNADNLNIQNGLGLLPFKHADILEVPNLTDFIKNIIMQNSDSLPQYISTSSPLDTDIKKQLHFILHSGGSSGASLAVYDNLGNLTGFSTTSNLVMEEIPDSDYQTLGYVTYISVPANIAAHAVVHRGGKSGSSGNNGSESFTLNIQETESETIIASTTFAAVPSGVSTTATIDIPADANGGIASSSPLVVDENGNGEAEITIQPILNSTVLPDFATTTLATTTDESNDNQSNNQNNQTNGNQNETNQISAGIGAGSSYFAPLPLANNETFSAIIIPDVVNALNKIQPVKQIANSGTILPNPVSVGANNTNPYSVIKTVSNTNSSARNAIAAAISANPIASSISEAAVGNFPISVKILIVIGVLLIALIIWIKFI